MPSRETRVVVPFPPTEDLNEKERREKLREKYKQVHDDAFLHTQCDSIGQFRDQFGVRDESEYVEVLQTGVARPCTLYDRTPEQKWVNTAGYAIRGLFSHQARKVVPDTFN